MIHPFIVTKALDIVWLTLLCPLPDLPVDDYVQLQVSVGDKSFNGFQVSPEVVGVENFKPGDGFELIHMVSGDLMINS